MCHGGDGSWYLAGVLTSYQCGARPRPAVYARVDQSSEWITNVVFGGMDL